MTAVHRRNIGESGSMLLVDDGPQCDTWGALIKIERGQLLSNGKETSPLSLNKDLCGVKEHKVATTHRLPRDVTSG